MRLGIAFPKEKYQVVLVNIKLCGKYPCPEVDAPENED
jgi:hypothetical protein